MTSGIYKIENTLTKDFYIGSTIDLKSRELRHFKDLKNGNHHSIILQRVYNKYGKTNLKFIVLEEDLLKENLLLREQYYIDTLSPLYNICKIAGSPLGTKHSIESSNKKREYVRKNMHTILPRLKKSWEAKSKEIYMLDYITLEVLKKFKSVSEAARYLNKDCTYASTITSCCKNKRFSAFGYRWVFNLDDISSLRDKIAIVPWNKGKSIDTKRGKFVHQYDLQMNLIKTWTSVKEAEYNIGKGISNCALGKSKTSNGFIWRY